MFQQTKRLPNIFQLSANYKLASWIPPTRRDLLKNLQKYPSFISLVFINSRFLESKNGWWCIDANDNELLFEQIPIWRHKKKKALFLFEKSGFCLCGGKGKHVCLELWVLVFNEGFIPPPTKCVYFLLVLTSLKTNGLLDLLRRSRDFKIQK